MAQIPLNDPSDPNCTVVLLPGRFGSPDDFSKAGFAAAVEQRGLDIELVAVDAHLGYYRDRSIAERLHHDVIAPLKAQDRQIWLAGASLGGLGSLIYLRSHPEVPSGAVLLAPFLGKTELIRKIEAAGGPLKWKRPADLRENTIEGLWEWIGSSFHDEPPIPIRIGFGDEDRLADGNRLFATLLPEDALLIRQGGHDWSVWAELWGDMLDQGFVCGDSS